MVPIRMLAALFIAATVVFAGVLLPPAYVLNGALPGKISYTAVSGRWWNFDASGAHYENLDLGTAEVDVAVLSLLTGNLEGNAILRGGDLEGQTGFEIDDAFVGFSDFHILLQITGTIGSQSLAGTLSVTGAELSLRADGSCVAGGARLRTDVAEGILAGYGGAPLLLEGSAKCDAGVLVFDLAKTLTGLTVAVVGQVDRSGGILATVTIGGPVMDELPEALSAQFLQAGWKRDGNSWVGKMDLSAAS